MPSLPRRASSLPLIALLALALGLGLAACGDSDDSADPTTTTGEERSSNDGDGGDDGGGTDEGGDEARRLGATVFEDAEFDVDEEVELCLGRTLIDAVGLEEAERLVAEDDLDEMSDDEIDVVRDAMNECVPGEVMAQAFIAGFSGDVPGFEGSELAECLTERLDGKVGDTMVELQRADDADAAAGLIGDCPTTELLASALAAGLAGSLPEAAVTCVVDQVVATTTFEEFLTADSDPAVDAQINQRLQDAIAACPT